MGQETKHSAIVEAATRVFLARGYTDTSVDVIAAEAGVSKQTIYNHFGNKEKLFRSVIQAAQGVADAEVGSDPAGQLGRLEEFLGESDDLGRDLREFARTAIRFVTRPDIAGLRRIVFAEAARHPELLEEWGQRRSPLLQALTVAIERQSKRGKLDVPEAELAAHQLMQLTITEALTRTFFGARQLADAEFHQVVDSGVELWLRAYET